MSNDEGVLTRIIAQVRALLSEQWRGRAGRHFRSGTQAISDFVEDNRVRPQDLLEDVVVHGRRKLLGLADHEHAAAEKNYAEAAKAFTESEDKKIETELKKRSLKIDILRKNAEVRKMRAEVRKSNAEASLAETQALQAQYELRRKLEESGMVLLRNDHGNLAVLLLKNESDLLSPRSQGDSDPAETA